MWEVARPGIGKWWRIERFGEGEVLTLLQLMESMFELGFLDVSDMRWRTPTKTFRKKGE